MAADGVFKRKNGFTAVQNEVARDLELSMKAKGLYLVIESYITMPDKIWKKSDFQAKVKEGEKAFDAAWSELKERGYLKMRMYSVGRNWEVEYELLDVREPGPHTFYYNKKGELVHTNETKQKPPGKVKEEEENSENQRIPQNGGNVNQRTPHYGSNVEGRYVEGRHVEGRYVEGSNVNGDNNNNTINKTIDNTIDNPSIHHEYKSNRHIVDPIILDFSEKISNRDDRWMYDAIKDNKGIPYEWLSNQDRILLAIQCMSEWNDYANDDGGNELEKAAYKIYIESIVEMLLEPEPVKYGNSTVNYSHVLKQINMLINVNGGAGYGYMPLFSSQAVERFVEKEKQEKIKNPKKYMKSLIWSLFSTSINDWEGYFHRSYYGGKNE